MSQHISTLSLLFFSMAFCLEFCLSLELTSGKQMHFVSVKSDIVRRNGYILAVDDDDDDEGRINFSVALSPKTTRTHNNKLKQ